MPLEFRLALYSTLAPPTCAIVWRLSFSRSQRAYSSIEEELNISVSHIRNKIVGVKSQLARELAKTNSKKSGKGRHECYKSTWIYWERLQFLKRCMFGIVWPPPNFQQAALSNMQPTCWIVQHLSFGRAFKSFSPATPVFLPLQNRRPVKIIWSGCCAPGSCMTVWRQPEVPFIFIRPILSELRPSQFSPRGCS